MLSDILLLTGAAITSAAPLTNDSSSLSWLIPVCGVSLVLIVVLIIVGKKRK